MTEDTQRVRVTFEGRGPEGEDVMLSADLPSEELLELLRSREIALRTKLAEGGAAAVMTDSAYEVAEINNAFSKLFALEWQLRTIPDLAEPEPPTEAERKPVMEGLIRDDAPDPRMEELEKTAQQLTDELSLKEGTIHRLLDYLSRQDAVLAQVIKLAEGDLEGDEIDASATILSEATQAIELPPDLRMLVEEHRVDQAIFGVEIPDALQEEDDG